MNLPKVLILTTNYGEGHLQVANALKEEFSSFGVTCTSRDLYYETSPLINEWTRKVYLKSYSSSGKQFYRLFYYGSKQISKRKNLKILCYGYSKLKHIIAEFEPDLIINTFPFFTVPFFRQKTNRYIPTYNVITDYCLHNLWVHPYIDKYYVATKQLKKELVNQGVNLEQVVVSGIPTNKAFQELEGHLKLTSPLPKKNMILIVAGAFGVSKEMKLICDLLKDDPSIHLTIVCGKNRELYQQLFEKYQFLPHIKVLPFVTNMHELLKEATCVVTKPGGVILSEAIATNTPVILPKATPGQEKENAQFFQQQGAAIWNEKIDQLVIETQQLVRDEQQQQRMVSALKSLQTPNSTKLIVNDILQDYVTRLPFGKIIEG